MLYEAAISGYDDQLSRLDDIDAKTIAGTGEYLGELARERRIHLFCSTLQLDGGAWWNAALYLPPASCIWTYGKVTWPPTSAGD